MFIIKPFDSATTNNLKTRNDKLPATNNNIKRSGKGQPSIMIRKNKDYKKIRTGKINKIPTKSFNLFN